ncbi:MAG: membrane protein [Nitrospira sp.]|nr:MAG: membrane protein [Nitrospira sp.]
MPLRPRLDTPRSSILRCATAWWAPLSLAVTRRALLSVLPGIVLSTVCLWYAFTGVDLAGMVREIGRVGPLWVMASVAVGLLSLVIRAVRWRTLLVGGKDIGTGSLVSATFIGMLANNVLPARIGEVVRAWVLARREHAPFPTVLASIVVERLLDMLAALAILALCLTLASGLEDGPLGELKRMGFLVLLVVLGCMAALAAMVRRRANLVALVERWIQKARCQWTQRALELIHRFLDGLCAIREAAHIGAVTVLSLLVWAVGICSFYVLAEGFGMSLNWIQTSLLFVIVLFGIAIPSAPGFIGTFHGFCVAGLSMVAGIDQTTAAAYATVLHGSQWLTINLFGLGFFWADRTLSWNLVSAHVRLRKAVLGTLE